VQGEGGRRRQAGAARCSVAATGLAFEAGPLLRGPLLQRCRPLQLLLVLLVLQVPHRRECVHATLAPNWLLPHRRAPSVHGCACARCASGALALPLLKAWGPRAALCALDACGKHGSGHRPWVGRAAATGPLLQWPLRQLCAVRRPPLHKPFLQDQATAAARAPLQGAVLPARHAPAPVSLPALAALGLCKQACRPRCRPASLQMPASACTPHTRVTLAAGLALSTGARGWFRLALAGARRAGSPHGNVLLRLGLRVGGSGWEQQQWRLGGAAGHPVQAVADCRTRVCTTLVRLAERGRKAGRQQGRGGRGLLVLLALVQTGLFTAAAACVAWLGVQIWRGQGCGWCACQCSRAHAGLFCAASSLDMPRLLATSPARQTISDVTHSKDWNRRFPCPARSCSSSSSV